MAKPTGAHLRRTPGLVSDDETRRFSRAVARKFGRSPFPDEVSPWLRPLEEVVSSRTRKAASPEGQALRQVVELRVEATGGWVAAPYDLTLVVIVEPGTLPTFRGDELPQLTSALNSWLYDDDGALKRTPAEVATRLAAASADDERYCAMDGLGGGVGHAVHPEGRGAAGGAGRGHRRRGGGRPGRRVPPDPIPSK